MKEMKQLNEERERREFNHSWNNTFQFLIQNLYVYNILLTCTKYLYISFGLRI